MARKEEFEIIVSPDGQIKLRAIGFSGKECVKPAEEIGKIISPGAPPVHEEKHAEYYQESEEKGKITGKSGNE